MYDPSRRCSPESHRCDSIKSNNLLLRCYQGLIPKPKRLFSFPNVGRTPTNPSGQAARKTAAPRRNLMVFVMFGRCQSDATSCQRVWTQHVAVDRLEFIAALCVTSRGGRPGMPHCSCHESSGDDGTPMPNASATPGTAALFGRSPRIRAASSSHLLEFWHSACRFRRMRSEAILPIANPFDGPTSPEIMPRA